MRKAGFVFGAMIAAVLALGSSAADEKVVPIKTIMKTIAGSKKEKGLCGKCIEAGKGEKWEDAQKLSKDLANCVANLPKNPCPKGDGKNWEKLSKLWAEQAKAIQKAADDKDAKAFNEATAAFTKACGACHKEHK